MNTIRVILLVLSITLAFSVVAQKRLIRGTVSDSQTGKPLKNAHVIVFGTTHGATTSDIGSFEVRMNLRKNKFVIVSFVGYATQNLDVTTFTELTIQLKPEVKDLLPINLNSMPSVFKTVPQSYHEGELVIVESEATYPGSIDAFRNSLGVNLLRTVPADWKSLVAIQFNVDSAGTLTDILVSDTTDLKPSRVRYILSKMPKWKPATQQQISISQKFQVEIFRHTVPAFKTSENAEMYRYIEQSLRYPQSAVKASVKGIVEYHLRLNPDGTIRKVKILKDIGEGCGEEVQRVVESIPAEYTKHLLKLTGFTSFRMPVYFLGGAKAGAFDMRLDDDGATLILPGVSAALR